MSVHRPALPVGSTRTFKAPSADEMHAANLRRDQMQAALAARLAGQVVEGATGPVVIPTRTVNTAPRLLSADDHLKALGLYRKSVKAAPVKTGYHPTTHRAPVVFPYRPEESRLSALSRPVSAPWLQLLASVSTTSCAGGRLSGAQGRNLARIVEELRKRCFLRVNGAGRPLQVREEVVLQVDGGQGQLAAACGLSPATFYRALQHPLAHLFLRTQKVQRDMENGDRQNVATLFTVSMYEPVMPACLEDACYAESVEQPGVFVLPALTSQIDGTKEGPVNIQIPERAVDNHNRTRIGLSLAADSMLQNTLSAAVLGSKAGAAFDNSSTDGSAGPGAARLDALNAERPDLFAFAEAIAAHHDAPTTRPAATVGYYKALLHLGAGEVRRQIGVIARWQKAGQEIKNSGALLMSLLNKKARAETGFNIRDLGTVKGSVSA